MEGAGTVRISIVTFRRNGWLRLERSTARDDIYIWIKKEAGGGNAIKKFSNNCIRSNPVLILIIFKV